MSLMRQNAIVIESKEEENEMENSKENETWWTDNKFQKVLVEIATLKDSKQKVVSDGMMIGDIIVTKEQLSQLIYTAIKIYGGLYTNSTPSYAQKYPNESRIDFMKRWNEIIDSLEKIRDTLN